MVNLLPLATSFMTFQYIVILLEKIASLAGMAALCSELNYMSRGMKIPTI